MTMVTEDFHKFSLDEYNGSNNVFFIQKIASVCKAEKKHSHDFMQIYYISNGLLKHVVGNDEVLLSRGDMFIIPPDLCHRIVRMNDNTEFVSISFSLDFINYSPYSDSFVNRFITFLLVDSAARVKVNTRPVIKLEGEYSVQLLSDISVMEEEFAKKKNGYQEINKGMLQKLLVFIGRVYFSTPYYTENASKYGTYNTSMLNCIDFVNKNFCSKLRIDDVAEKFLISRTYFCHLFKHYTGMSFKVYVNNLRVNRAQSLIKETNLSMEEIACSVGYQGTANFYKNFKRIVGTTPVKFKDIGKLE